MARFKIGGLLTLQHPGKSLPKSPPLGGDGGTTVLSYAVPGTGHWRATAQANRWDRGRTLPSHRVGRLLCQEDRPARDGSQSRDASGDGSAAFPSIYAEARCPETAACEAAPLSQVPPLSHADSWLIVRQLGAAVALPRLRQMARGVAMGHPAPDPFPARDIGVHFSVPAIRSVQTPGQAGKRRNPHRQALTATDLLDRSSPRTEHFPKFQCPIG